MKNDDKDIYIEELKYSINYWMDLVTYTAEAKKNAVNEVFKLNPKLKAVYWLLFIGFTPKKVSMLSTIEIEEIYNYKKLLKHIGAEMYIRFACGIDHWKSPEEFSLIDEILNKDNPSIDSLYLLSKDINLKSIWILLYSGFSNDFISHFLNKPSNEIEEIKYKLDSLELHRTKRILKLISPNPHLTNSFKSKWLSKKKHTIPFIPEDYY